LRWGSSWVCRRRLHATAKSIIELISGVLLVWPSSSWSLISFEKSDFGTFPFFVEAAQAEFDAPVFVWISTGPLGNGRPYHLRYRKVLFRPR
jgi:hypothetical protein